jgi:hypothetical protein
MAKYGMCVGDYGGSPWALQFESGDNYTSFADPDPWIAYARSQGIQGTTTRDRAYALPLQPQERRRLEEQAEGARARAVEEPTAGACAPRRAPSRASRARTRSGKRAPEKEEDP